MLGIFTATFLILMVISNNVTASPVDAGDVITVPELIFECYDGNGFADNPGAYSTLEATLAAVQLLQQYGPSQWHADTWQYLDDIAENYAAMQSGYRGGFVLGDVEIDAP